jgi:hypothetical protein
MLFLILGRNTLDSQMRVRDALSSSNSLEVWFLVIRFVLASAVKPAVTFGISLRLNFKDRLYLVS